MDYSNIIQRSNKDSLIIAGAFSRKPQGDDGERLRKILSENVKEIFTNVVSNLRLLKANKGAVSESDVKSVFESMIKNTTTAENFLTAIYKNKDISVIKKNIFEIIRNSVNKRDCVPENCAEQIIKGLFEESPPNVQKIINTYSAQITVPAEETPAEEPPVIEEEEAAREGAAREEAARRAAQEKLEQGKRRVTAPDYKPSSPPEKSPGIYPRGTPEVFGEPKDTPDAERGYATEAIDLKDQKAKGIQKRLYDTHPILKTAALGYEELDAEFKKLIPREMYVEFIIFTDKLMQDSAEKFSGAGMSEKAVKEFFNGRMDELGKHENTAIIRFLKELFKKHDDVKRTFIHKLVRYLRNYNNPDNSNAFTVVRDFIGILKKVPESKRLAIENVIMKYAEDFDGFSPRGLSPRELSPGEAQPQARSGLEAARASERVIYNYSRFELNEIIPFEAYANIDKLLDMVLFNAFNKKTGGRSELGVIVNDRSLSRPVKAERIRAIIAGVLDEEMMLMAPEAGKFLENIFNIPLKEGTAKDYFMKALSKYILTRNGRRSEIINKTLIQAHASDKAAVENISAQYKAQEEESAIREGGVKKTKPEPGEKKPAAKEPAKEKPAGKSRADKPRAEKLKTPEEEKAIRAQNLERKAMEADAAAQEAEKNAKSARAEERRAQAEARPKVSALELEEFKLREQEKVKLVQAQNKSIEAAEEVERLRAAINAKEKADGKISQLKRNVELIKGLEESARAKEEEAMAKCLQFEEAGARNRAAQEAREELEWSTKKRSDAMRSRMKQEAELKIAEQESQKVEAPGQEAARILDEKIKIAEQAKTRVEEVRAEVDKKLEDIKFDILAKKTEIATELNQKVRTAEELEKRAKQLRQISDSTKIAAGKAKTEADEAFKAKHKKPEITPADEAQKAQEAEKAKRRQKTEAARAAHEANAAKRREEAAAREGAEKKGRIRKTKSKVKVGKEKVTRKPRADKPRADKPRADKPRADKPRADKPRADKPRADKPRVDKPQAEEKRRRIRKTKTKIDGFREAAQLPARTTSKSAGKQAPYNSIRIPEGTPVKLPQKARDIKVKVETKKIPTARGKFKVVKTGFIIIKFRI